MVKKREFREGYCLKLGVVNLRFVWVELVVVRRLEIEVLGMGVFRVLESVVSEKEEADIFFFFKNSVCFLRKFS